MMAAIKTKDARPAPKADDTVTSYILSIQAERFHRTVRYHWMVCGAQDPGQLVSWGHAPTQEQAESAASAEIRDLSSGATQGGRVVSAIKPYTRR